MIYTPMRFYMKLLPDPLYYRLYPFITRVPRKMKKRLKNAGFELADIEYPISFD